MVAFDLISDMICRINTETTAIAEHSINESFEYSLFPNSPNRLNCLGRSLPCCIRTSCFPVLSALLEIHSQGSI